MQKSRNAFSMIELVFVIVVLGILAAIAVPQFSATRDDAHVSKGRADLASIRSGIVTERQTRLIKGDSSWISTANLDSGGLFGGVLMYPMTSSTANGHWSGSNGNYTYKVKGSSCAFTYSNTTGKFTLNSAQDAICSQLAN